MKKIVCSIVIAVSPLLVLRPVVAQASQPEQNTAARRDNSSAARAREQASASGDTAEQAGVIITSSSALDNYSTYQSGNRFYVVMPESADPRMQIGKPGAGFEDARVQKRGDQIILSFVLQNGMTARASHKIDRVEITFVASDEPADEISSGATRIAPDSNVAATVRAISAGAIESDQSSAAGKLISYDPAKAEPLPLVASEAKASAPSLAPAATAKAPQPAGGQTNTGVDLSVPESPAFTVLGLTPQTVIRPASPRALATSLLNGVDRQGNFQTGIAIDTSPYMLFAGEKLTLSEYRASPVTRMLARTQMSFATTKGASEADKSSRVALGFHVTPWDLGDPRMDLLLSKCFRDKLVFGRPEQTDAEVEQINNQIANGCRADAARRNWNRSSWVIGAAPSWISTTGNIRDLRWNGGGVWTSLAYGFEGVPALKDTSQLILHARYRTNERVPDPKATGQFFTQDGLFLGSRLRVGVPDFTANFEGVFIHNKPQGRDSDDSYRLSFGAEKKVASNIWLTVTFGGEGGRSDGKNQGFVLTTFKYGLSKGPQ